MSFLSKKKVMGSDEYISFIKDAAKSHQLCDVLQAIYESRNCVKAFEGKAADGVFSLILKLASSNDNIIERELIIRNSVSHTSQDHSMEKYIWGMVSDVAFQAGVSLAPESCRELIKDCLCSPTDMKFAIFHSDVIASVVKMHVEILNPSLIELLIETTDDSRAIYALKMAYYLPRWSDVSDAILKALLSECGPKRVEAMWLMNNRGKCSDVIDFIKKRGFDAILSSGTESMDIKRLTAAVMKANGLSCDYSLATNRVATLPVVGRPHSN